jgi:Holliday junction resolvasome RuvABC endonuclease subunit
MIIIGIDQSLTYTGVSIVSESRELLECFEVKPTNKAGVERLDFITTAIIKIVIDTMSANPSCDVIVVREGFSFGSHSSSVFDLGGLGGCIDLTLYKLARNLKTMVPSYQAKMSEYSLPPTTWKKLIFGMGNTKKDTTYLLKAYKATGIEFKNDNDADSYMIASAFMAMRTISYGGDMPKLTEAQKESCMTPGIRKKNSVTKKNISQMTEEVFRELAKKSLEEYLEFK